MLIENREGGALIVSKYAGADTAGLGVDDLRDILRIRGVPDAVRSAVKKELRRRLCPKSAGIRGEGMPDRDRGLEIERFEGRNGLA